MSKQSSKIRVLFVSNSANLAGAEKSLLDILTHIDRSKFEISLLCPRKGPLYREASQHSIRIFTIPYAWWITFPRFYWVLFFFWPLNFLTLPFLKSLIKKERFDVIYSNAATVVSGALAARALRIPHIWHMREPLGNGPQEYGCFFAGRDRLSRFISSHADHLVANSANTKSCLSKSDSMNISVIYNGFNPPPENLLGSPQRNTLRDKLRIPENAYAVAVVGSIQKNKGQIYAVRAMTRILEKIPNAVLIIAGSFARGSSRYERELRSAIRQDGLDEKVIFTGFSKNISDIYQSADCLVSPSLHEPFGRSLVEALLWKVPVIATRAGGPLEIIENEKTGLLIDVQSSEQIANAVIRIHSDPNLEKTLKSAGFEDAGRRFGMKSMVQSVENLITEACNKQPA